MRWLIWLIWSLGKQLGKIKDWVPKSSIGAPFRPPPPPPNPLNDVIMKLEFGEVLPSELTDAQLFGVQNFGHIEDSNFRHRRLVTPPSLVVFNMVTDEIKERRLGKLRARKDRARDTLLKSGTKLGENIHVQK